MANISEDHETVGAVVLDLHGTLAAAGSSGGMTGQMKVVVGHMHLLGGDIHADDDVALVWYVSRHVRILDLYVANGN